MKDLRIFNNRDLKNVVLIDNAAYSFACQVENGIPIVSYYKGDEDRELKAMIPYLKSLIKANDVRSYNKHYLKLESYTHANSVDQLKEILC